MTSKVEYNFYLGEVFNKYWKNKEGQYHREDGPAIEYSNGTRIWFKNGLKHREDGPAIVWEDWTHRYYLNGICYTKEESWKEIQKIKEERERNDCES